MRQFILTAIAALALAGCGANGAPMQSAASAAPTLAAAIADAAGVPAAPLTRTILDEKGLTLAAQAVDVAALSASALVKAHVITPGSPAALRLADGLDRARDGINLAALARDAGNAPSYTAALAKAGEALAGVKAVLNGSN